jgi:hypothetical protein
VALGTKVVVLPQSSARMQPARVSSRAYAAPIGTAPAPRPTTTASMRPESGFAFGLH